MTNGVWHPVLDVSFTALSTLAIYIYTSAESHNGLGVLAANVSHT